MRPGDFDDITALVGGGVGHGHGRIADHHFGSRIDQVRDSVLILNLIHITDDDKSADSVRGHLEGQFSTRLASKLSDIDSAKDDLTDIVEILTFDGYHITRENLRR